MPSSILTAEIVEERWTPTTMQVTFCLPSLPRDQESSCLSINLPLLSLGWTFALSSTPVSLRDRKGQSKISIKSSAKIRDWNPVALSFSHHDSSINWGDTSMHAQLSFAMDPPCASDHPLGLFGDNCSPQRDATLLGVMKVALAHISSVEIPLASHTLPLSSYSKVSLAMTMSDCPFSTGFFYIRSSRTNEASAQAWVVKQSGDCLLSQLLTTGKIYDTIFLTRSTSGRDGEPLETYASLSVLEGHIDLASAKVSKEWKSALEVSSRRDDTGAKRISCPDGYDHELDSDFSEDEALPDEQDSATLKGQRPESRTEEISPISSSVIDAISDPGLIESLPGEIIQSPRGPPRLLSAAPTDHERTISIEFVAHRTWRAFLWYCYTGRLQFSNLKSQVEHDVRHFHAVGDGPPSCSPKSMYRLAYLVGDKGLKVKVLKAIRERMTEANVLDEAFSVFTSKYPEVRDVQLDMLMEYCKTAEVKKAFLRTMSKFGNMPHAEPVLEAFYERLAA